MTGLDPTVQVAIVGGGFTLMTAVVGVLAERLRRQGRTLSEVAADSAAAREQVQNTHSTNLREDVDRVLAGLERVIEGQERHSAELRQHGREIGGLRQELRHERAERLSVEERLDQHIETSRP